MGDRANIVVCQKMSNGEEGKIFLYTHWDGCALPKILQDALIRGRGRWNDEAYLTRIIFSEMIKDSLLEDTGYGISLYAPDANHTHIYVNVDANMVTIGEKGWSFKDYVEMEDLPEY